MKRFLFTTTFAALGVTLIAAQSQAAGNPGSGSGRSSGGFSHTLSGRSGEFNHSFRASRHFDYGRFGYKSLHWTRYGWSSRYNSYCYWAPRYGWCFYEPTYSCYLPISYFPEVYPQAGFTTTPVASTLPVVSPSSSVVQQTSVVVGGPAVATADVPAPPLAAPTITPAPTAVQQTKVGPGIP
jgi:hypothetical protein